MKKGTHHTEEHKKHMSSVMKGREILWKDEIGLGNKGKHRSDEFKQRLSVKLKGHKVSEEQIKKLKNTIQSDEWKSSKGKIRIEKIRKATLGHSVTDLTKKKISSNLIKYYIGKGVNREPYSIDWRTTLKRAIRERDNYICQVCSKYGWVIHHIDYNKKNCSPENLICLCKSCHAKTNHNRNKWIEYFKNVNKN